MMKQFFYQYDDHIWLKLPYNTIRKDALGCKNHSKAQGDMFDAS